MHEQRLLESLNRLAECTDTPGAGVTRFSWSNADRQARAYIEIELKSIGLCPWTDGIGNIRARMKGKENIPPVIMGSHLDSVRNGGRYDGAYGVVAALEVLRSFHDQGYTPRMDVELIAFAEEEGSNFGSTCLGSKAVTGQASVDDLKLLRSNTGLSAYQVLKGFGLNPDTLPQEQITPSSATAYLEVHIEQNDVLERTGHSLGIVSAISGMRLHRVTLHGHSDHAASPMQGRRDPMAGFVEVARGMRQLWMKGVLPADFSCTVGSIECSPNVGIVIPHVVSFTVDIRHVDVPTLEEGWLRIASIIDKVAKEEGLAVEITRRSASGGVRMSPAIGNAFHAAAVKNDVQPLSMTSGPAHDAAPMGMVVPAGMLFVPSIGGFSHCEQEETSFEHLVLGAKVLEDTVRAL
ncbi:MAG: M20 family metallo-hydrolase [Desulfovibrionales bacterium]|nr:M20 family metallo-hydrolase [Desulfovibrionales bacterium]